MLFITLYHYSLVVDPQNEISNECEGSIYEN